MMREVAECIMAMLQDLEERAGMLHEGGKGL